MKIVDYPLSNGQWIAEKQKKKYIVWHGTMGRTAKTPYNGQPGQATTSIDGWNQDKVRIGTPYLVDRNGTIYRTFKDDREWIYHLGLSGTDGAYDKVSVGIEFANELQLIKSGGDYYAFDRVHHNTRYVGDVFNQDWRAHEWWARLDEDQVDAGIELTLELCARYNIPKIFYYPSTQYDYPRCFEVARIICHSNCRKDKTDLILQEWVWAKLREAGFHLIGSEQPVAVPVSIPTVPTSLPEPKPFRTAAAKSGNENGSSSTSGLSGTLIDQLGVTIVDATEELEAERNGKLLGRKTVRQVRTTKGNVTTVDQPDYCWMDRLLPSAELVENSDGFNGVPDISGEATYFGKYDDVDEGTGTPALKTAQTNSSVFGLALPQADLIKHGLAEKVNGKLRATPKGLAARVDVYVPKMRRLARLPLVDVGPSTTAVADLTAAAVAWLQNKPEEKADGYKIDHPIVEIRIP